MLPDPLLLVLAFVYVLTAIGVGELLRRTLHCSPDWTRKFIHIAVGMISVPTVLLFQRLVWAIIPPLVFVVVNYLDYRWGVIQAMTTSGRSNLGTVYFPLSFAVILALFWGDPSGPAAQPRLIVAALMPMTWGDALAAMVGGRVGRRRYRVLGATRSVEGSVTMFIVSAVATFLASGVMSPAGLSVALVTALGATVAEALSPWGMDNLTVPAISALSLAVMTGLLF